MRLAPSTPEIFAMEPGPGLRSELGGNSPIGDSPPEALFLLMREAWKRYRLPIYITEGGIADDKGTMRGPLIRGQVEAIQRARAEGVAVEGYFHWSLMDNFEWEKGFRPRFGLYRVDRQTLARTPAGGADVFHGPGPAAVTSRRLGRGERDQPWAAVCVVQHEHPVEHLARVGRRELALARVGELADGAWPGRRAG